MMRRLVLGAVVVLLGFAALACSSGDGGASPPSNESPGSTEVDEVPTVESLATEVLSYATSEPIATIDGVVPTSDGDVPATAEVIALDGTPRSTVLLFRITTASVVDPEIGFLEADEYGHAIDGVTLTDGETVHYPSIWRTGSAELAQYCACTDVVLTLGPEGVWMSAEYGALDDGTDMVTLTIPGFEPTEVPVVTGT